nr:hypothetical protein [Streptomyces sp. S1D4-11]
MVFQNQPSRLGIELIGGGAFRQLACGPVSGNENVSSNWSASITR